MGLAKEPWHRSSHAALSTDPASNDPKWTRASILPWKTQVCNNDHDRIELDYFQMILLSNPCWSSQKPLEVSIQAVHSHLLSLPSQLWDILRSSFSICLFLIHPVRMSHPGQWHSCRCRLLFVIPGSQSRHGPNYDFHSFMDVLVTAFTLTWM